MVSCPGCSNREGPGSRLRWTLLGVLRNRNFVLIWLDQFVASLGDYFYWLAMPLSLRDKYTAAAKELAK